MTPALAVADAVRRVLMPFLAVSALLTAAMLAVLIGQRLVRNALESRRRHLSLRYGPLVARVLDSGVDATVEAAARRVPRRHLRIVGDLLLDQIRSLSGSSIARARAFARALTLDAVWRRDAGSPRWWRRARATRALGVAGVSDAFTLVVERLDDADEEVRAAAAEALGRLGDVRAVGPLIDRLADQSRNQRVRIIEALHRLGQAAGGELLRFVRARPDRLPLVSDLLAVSAGSAAADDLIEWSGSAHPVIRAAAMAVLGSIGLDERAYYYALRALDDEDAGVRAMAARALGRSGRTDAAPYLAGRLADEWPVAAQSARALSRLSSPGRAVLEQHARDTGQAGDLARQVLWEVTRGVG